MKAAFDEIIAIAVKRQHEPQRIVGDLLAAEISEKQARSIKRQITIAKLPLARENVEDFAFDDKADQRDADPLMRELAAHDRSTIIVFAGGKEIARSVADTSEDKIAALLDKAN